MQAGGRLVEDVQGFTGIALGQFLGQFYPLGFAAGQGDGALAEADVRQANVDQGLQFSGNEGDGVEEFAAFFNGHFQHFVDVFAFVADFEGFSVVAFAFADVAGHVHVGQEVHFYFDYAIALAGFAAAAFDVE